MLDKASHLSRSVAPIFQMNLNSPPKIITDSFYIFIWPLAISFFRSPLFFTFLSSHCCQSRRDFLSAHDMNPKPRVYFLANVCHVCKSKNADYSCEICKMIFYCSVEHRRENWFDHSELCWAINKICDGRRCEFLWETYSKEDFTKFRHEVAERCTKLLNRSLKPWEFEIIYFPRVCSVCRNFQNLTRCKDCEYIYTCDKAHFPNNHKKWCKTLKLYCDLSINQPMNNPEFDIKLKDNSYKSMADVITQLKGNEIRIAMTSELLTYPLTVLHGLKLLNNHKDTKLNILFIGAEIQAEVEPLNKWEKFLLHPLKNVKFLNLIFLGPELYEPVKATNELCESCRKQQKRIKCEYIRGFYHDYAADETERPNIICALNSGMYRDFGFKNENSWKVTIQKLFACGNPPVLITEYTSRELGLVLDKIRNLCGDVCVKALPTVNPFASLKPGLNIISENETPVIFKNYFYTILQSTQ